MAKFVYPLPDLTDCTDNLSMTRVFTLPVKQKCDIVDRSLVTDPCLTWNKTLCGSDSEYYQPVCIRTFTPKDPCAPPDLTQTPGEPITPEFPPCDCWIRQCLNFDPDQFPATGNPFTMALNFYVSHPDMPPSAALIEIKNTNQVTTLDEWLTAVAGTSIYNGFSRVIKEGNNLCIYIDNASVLDLIETSPETGLIDLCEATITFTGGSISVTGEGGVGNLPVNTENNLFTYSQFEGCYNPETGEKLDSFCYCWVRQCLTLDDTPRDWSNFVVILASSYRQSGFQVQGNQADIVGVGFNATSRQDWLEKAREFFGPIDSNVGFSVVQGNSLCIFGNNTAYADSGFNLCTDYRYQVMDTQDWADAGLTQILDNDGFPITLTELDNLYNIDKTGVTMSNYEGCYDPVTLQRLGTYQELQDSQLEAELLRLSAETREGVCEETDTLDFQFHFVDRFNNWPVTGGTHGWKETPQQTNWLIQIELLDDCFNPSGLDMPEFATQWWVGSDGRGKFHQQVRIDPDRIPFDIFSFRITVYNSQECKQKQFYTQQYRKEICAETLSITGIYEGDVGCRLEYENFRYTQPLYVLGSYFDFDNTYRVPGEFIRTGISILREEDENSNSLNAQVRERYRLRSRMLPPYVVDRLAHNLAADASIIDGQEFVFSGELSKTQDTTRMWAIEALLETAEVCENDSRC